MGMAVLLAEMPDLWRAALAEHVSDHHGLCVVCRDSSGLAASWPCLTHQVATEAERIYEGGLLDTFAGRHARR